MWFADKPLFAKQGRALIPTLLCAITSALLMRSGFASFLFLIPLGFITVMHDLPAAWLSWAIASLINVFATIFIFRYFGFLPWFLNFLYFAVISAGFIWIMTGGKSGIRTANRFIIASLAGVSVFLLIIFNPTGRSAYEEIVKNQAEIISSVYITASGADAVSRSLLERSLTQDNMLNIITGTILRGAALTSCFFLFFVSRQAALIFSSLFHRKTKAAELSNFHAPQAAIWILSISLGAILIFRNIGINIPEILAWNILAICVIMFLAQGAGIIFYNIKNRSPAMHLLGNVVVIIIFFTPGINLMAFCAVFLLGIAENWLPLRKPKDNNPASTPGL